jgi:hypothetical protein
MRKWQMIVVLSVTLGMFLSNGAAQERDKHKTMEEMQKALNEEVVSQPFSVADEAQVKAYIEDATRRGVVPQPYKGTYWRPGYTCADLWRYSRREYRACRYYHWYYGHYYR